MYYISALIATFNLCLQVDNRVKEYSWLGLRFTSALAHRSLPGRVDTSHIAIVQTRPATLQLMLGMINIVIRQCFCDFRRNYRIK
jgi:hypothetical protein